jgi:ABC-type Na+ efflux pump permease subunit
MLKKLNKKFVGVFAFALALVALGANTASAQVPSATSTMENIMTTVINTTVDLVTTVFSTYWPYILVFGIISGLVAAFVRFTKLGSK